MSQQTLDSVREICLEEIKEYLPPAKAKPRDPETAESAHEWAHLYQAKYGQHPDAREQIKVMDQHPEWADGFTRAKRNYRKALR